jgi:hypothetical protein
VDKGKSEMIKLEKLKKSVHIPLQIGGAFKIYEPKAQVSLASLATQPMKKSPVEKKKKPTEMPPQVARVLKLMDEDEVSEV